MARWRAVVGRRPGGLSPWLIILLALLLLPVTSCRGQGATRGDAQLTLSISPQPYITGPAEISIDLLDVHGKPITGAKVTVEGNMSHAGMVPVLAETTEVSDGRYLSENFRFTMGGDWFVTVMVDSGESRFERVFDVKGVAGDRMPMGKGH